MWWVKGTHGGCLVVALPTRLSCYDDVGDQVEDAVHHQVYQLLKQHPCPHRHHRRHQPAARHHHNPATVTISGGSYHKHQFLSRQRFGRVLCRVVTCFVATEVCLPRAKTFVATKHGFAKMILVAVPANDRLQAATGNVSRHSSRNF